MKLWGPRVLRLDGMTWLVNDGQCKQGGSYLELELTISPGPLLPFRRRATAGFVEDIYVP